MKKTLILSTLLALFLSSEAQQSNYFIKYFGKQPSKQKGFHKAEVKHLPQQTLFYSREPNNDNWKFVDSTITTYTDNGLASSELKYRLNGNQVRTNYLYDISGRQTGITELNWNTTSNSWDSISKGSTTYDLVGNQTEDVFYKFYASNGWVIEYGSKFEYIYNASNLPTQVISQYKDEQTNGYINESKSLYEYNNGILISLTAMSWDDDQVEFVNESKFTDIIWHKWNKNIEEGLLSSANEQKWKGTDYELAGRFSYVYDLYDNEIENKEEVFNGTTWFTDYWYKFLLTYDAAGALTEHIEQIRNDTGWVHNLRFVYSNFMQYSGVKNNTNQHIELTISPNPFAEKAEISILGVDDMIQFKLYDLVGKNVMSQDIHSGKGIIEKGNLQPGLYFYSILNNNQTIELGKLIIE